MARPRERPRPDHGGRRHRAGKPVRGGQQRPQHRALRPGILVEQQEMARAEAGRSLREGVEGRRDADVAAGREQPDAGPAQRLGAIRGQATVVEGQHRPRT
ncbi:hypothetical protein [Methylobacterium gregans]|uniref:hypothetical protein n=1 Tax=Methylobacterium gregans TaxID=374424 RepID=UPI00361F8182